MRKQDYCWKLSSSPCDWSIDLFEMNDQKEDLLHLCCDETLNTRFPDIS